MSNLDQQLANFEAAIVKLREDFKNEVEAAYMRGFDDGVLTNPNHKKFHEVHQEPVWYGEDGEIVVLSGKFDFDTAVAKISEFLKPDLDPEYLNDVDINTHAEKIALAPEGDECDYYASRSREGVFDAWVWRLG